MSDRVQSVDRALTMLMTLAAGPHPLTATELATQAGVNRATAWRLLSTLEHFDLVARSESGRYHVSAGAWRLATASSVAALADRARPWLKRLARLADAGVFLQVASAGDLLVVAEARPTSPVQVDLSGVDVPLHCGSVGKLYLASLPEPVLADFLAGSLPALTPATITDPQRLRDEVDAARAFGVAYNVGEHHLDWCGVTAAVRDPAGRDLAYVNVTMPRPAWPADVTALTGQVVETADAIAASLASVEPLVAVVER
jgi:DNA-binding IclR family transcriptional regulator